MTLVPTSTKGIGFYLQCHLAIWHSPKTHCFRFQVPSNFKPYRMELALETCSLPWNIQLRNKNLRINPQPKEIIKRTSPTRKLGLEAKQERRMAHCIWGLDKCNDKSAGLIAKKFIEKFPWLPYEHRGHSRSQECFSYCSNDRINNSWSFTFFHQ